MENYYIKEHSIGKAWQEAIKLISKNGKAVLDGEEKLYEILGLQIKIEKPNINDPILEKKGQQDMITWMKNNFFSNNEVLNWGYSYGQRLTNYEGINQLENIEQKLLTNIDSKSATICLNSPKRRYATFSMYKYLRF